MEDGREVFAAFAEDRLSGERGPAHGFGGEVEEADGGEGGGNLFYCVAQVLWDVMPSRKLRQDRPIASKDSPIEVAMIVRCTNHDHRVASEP